MQKRYRKTKEISVSAIVPVFNEEKTVKSLINTLLKSPFVDELICINDGSSDRSLKILKNFKDKIILINLKKNRGKGNALSLGIKKAKGKIVVFFDADLVNLSDKHIRTLLSPLLKMGKGRSRLSCQKRKCSCCFLEYHRPEGILQKRFITIT